MLHGLTACSLLILCFYEEVNEDEGVLVNSLIV